MLVGISIELLQPSFELLHWSSFRVLKRTYLRYHRLESRATMALRENGQTNRAHKEGALCAAKVIALEHNPKQSAAMAQRSLHHSTHQLTHQGMTATRSASHAHD